jgi:polysaccharide export outer membrane protein
VDASGQPAAGTEAARGSAPAASAVVPPAGYIIGADDVLSVVFWREQDMSAEVVVRPDGNISLPLLNDLHAAGLTPDQLRVKVTDAAVKFVESPSVTVVVKAINSRKVYVTGNVLRAGTYPLSGPMTVLQVLALAGGVVEFADTKNITIMRTEDGRPRAFKFNYKDVSKGKGLDQNIVLQPGDTVVVP